MWRLEVPALFSKYGEALDCQSYADLKPKILHLERIFPGPTTFPSVRSAWEDFA